MINTDISKALLGNSRIPVIGNFELTRKCPLNCVICYNERKQKRELTTDEILNILNQIADAGCVHINFTGGDPLTRVDFPDIYRHAIKLGMFPSIESELVHLTDDAREVLCEYPPYVLSASLYAVDDDVFRTVTRTSFSADCVFNHIRELLAAGVPIRARTPFTKLNIGQAGKIARFCREVGITYNPTTKIFWTQDGSRMDDLRCSPDFVMESSDGDPIYDYLYSLTANLWNKPIVKHSCDTGISDFNISAFGEMNFCITFWKPEYDLLNGSFEDAWNNWYPLFRRPEGNYCLGKALFGDGKNCPWGCLYSNPEIDTSKSLLEHAKDRIHSMQCSGYSLREICNQLGLSDKALNVILNL